VEPQWPLVLGVLATLALIVASLVVLMVQEFRRHRAHPPSVQWRARAPQAGLRHVSSTNPLPRPAALDAARPPGTGFTAVCGALANRRFPVAPSGPRFGRNSGNSAHLRGWSSALQHFWRAAIPSGARFFRATRGWPRASLHAMARWRARPRCWPTPSNRNRVATSRPADLCDGRRGI
jgi:hypothetical protein